MSTEQPAEKIYARLEYNPEIHCGAVVDRNIDSLREKKEKADLRIRTFGALAEVRNLTPVESRQLARATRRGAMLARVIKNTEARGPDDRPCVHRKGRGTDHPGTGYCQYHCACKGRPGGHLSYYSRKALDKKLSDVIDEMERSGEDILNLEPDVMLLRAKIKLFIDDKQDFDPETVKSLTLLSEQLRKMVETINDKKFKTSISIETFTLIQYRMVEVLQRYITDPDVLNQIAEGWQKISVETSAKNKLQLASGN